MWLGRLKRLCISQLSGVDLLLLDTQYRMHPAIANIPNKLFYDGLIKTGISASDRPPPIGGQLSNPPPPSPSHVIFCSLSCRT